MKFIKGQKKSCFVENKKMTLDKAVYLSKLEMKRLIFDVEWG